MTPQEIMYAVIFFVTLFGAIFGVWKYLDSKMISLRAEAQTAAAAVQALASLAREELAAHRLHCAEVFATKQGMHEQTAQIMRAIEGVGSRIDGVHERLDRAFDHPHVTPPAPRRRTSN